MLTKSSGPCMVAAQPWDALAGSAPSFGLYSEGGIMRSP